MTNNLTIIIPKNSKETNIHNRYKCDNYSEYFSIENLFSELVDEYQRSIARKNLGIEIVTPDIISPNWGNIDGDINQQGDLLKLINSCIHAEANLLYINYTSTWGPNALITISWLYLQNIESQSINGNNLDINVRSYTLSGISNDISITLEYVYNGVTVNKTINIPINYKILYGFSSENLQESESEYINVSANNEQFIYIGVPSNLLYSISVNGIEGGFEPARSKNFNGVSYQIYKSIHSDLGQTTIKVSKVK